MRCDHYQTLLLDHLYGLLDDHEAAEVDTHLTGCTGCNAAREAAAAAQGLFARAAKSTFPNVRFVPPDQAVTVDLTATPERKRGSAVHPLPNGRHAEPAKPAQPARRAFTRASWGRWAVAASLLVLIPAAVVPVSGWASKSDAARRVCDRTEAEYADACAAHERLSTAFSRDQAGKQAALTAARQKHAQVLSEWVKEEQLAAQQNAANRVTVAIDRPASLQPGAPNEFVVYVRGSGRDVVEAEVRDQNDKVVFRQALDHEKKGGQHKVRLPAEVWSRVDPQSELYLAVSKVDEKTGTRTELQDKVRLFGPVFTTLLVTDKPTYRPGERLFFRSLTLDRVSFRPPAHEQLLRYELRKIDGKADGTPVPGLAVAGSAEVARVTEAGVDPVLGPDGKPVRGVGCGSFALPANLPDGDYVLTLTEKAHPAGYARTIGEPVKRTVRVRAGAIEQYQKKIEFAATAYSPGDTVEAWAELKQNDKPVKDVAVEAFVVANGQNLHAQAIPIRTRP
ncbi:MAG TPA: zf-HC2 domain-containing protein, partial [Gemmataceae bacterium]|nr:zf-HC2 domain-containing protein [Gemmataceae bacterium]